MALALAQIQQFLLLGVATLQFCFMCWPSMNLKTVTVSRSNPFLAEQPGSPWIKDLTSKNTPWRIMRLGHGRMQLIFMAIVVTKVVPEESHDVPWVRKTLSPKPPQPFAVAPVSIPQFNDLCSRPQTIKPRNTISLWPTQKLAFLSLLLSQKLTTVGS